MRNTTQKSICQLVLSLPIGGTEKVVESLIIHTGSKQELACICLDFTGELGEKLKTKGYSIAVLSRKPGFDFSIPLRIALLLRKHKIEILHCHHYSPWVYGILAKLLHPSIKVIFTEHGRFYPDSSSWKRRLFNSIMQRFTSHITAVSPAVKTALMEMEGFHEARIKVIYNGVPAGPLSILESRSALRKKLNLSPDKKSLIFVGRFDSIKWITGLIGAFHKVASARENVELILLGDGPERNSIETIISQKGLLGKVILPGFKNNIPQWLKASDCFVLSSLSEGTSISLIEAMAMGLPAVATQVGGNEFVLEHGTTGILVPPRNEKQLAKGILQILNNPALAARFSNNAKERFNRLFHMEVMLKNFNKLYTGNI